MRKWVLLAVLVGLLYQHSAAENGYELWLRYAPVHSSKTVIYRQFIRSIVLPDTSATQQIIREEWSRACKSLLDKSPAFSSVNPTSGNSIVYLRPESILLRQFPDIRDTGNSLKKEGYLIRSIRHKQQTRIALIANTDIGWLYASFHLLRLMQTEQSITDLDIRSIPRIQLRLLNHWDNLDRSVERGYAGQSIWNWHTLPTYADQRYTDYARANASIGINGTVLTNVNANATVLTTDYLQKVKKLAAIFRPYGIKVYLTARFSAPAEIGGLPTADPLDQRVQNWWKEKCREIYTLIPDFGGFLVKANSEGQPGPQNYGRTHADGANMLADAVQPFGGIIMWRAFVYSNELPEDRHKQANLEFEPLDGAFRNNVMVQVKNGAIDFQPREPFHPLFGAMPRTPLLLELQITQEYLGQATNLVYLAPLFKECLDSDTYRPAKGNTVAQLIDDSNQSQQLSGIAGVANIGADLNWTGHPMAQSNWYAFGRLAWDHQLSATTIAGEWLRMTFSNDTAFVQTATDTLLQSREACVNYMTPLGLHHLMGTGHHYGPAPWVNDLPRADWTPAYYHKADKQGIGFNRSSTGSRAVEQYAAYWQQQWNDPSSTDERLLLWFHHLPWSYTMKSGRSLWAELCYAYDAGVKQVRAMQQQWSTLISKTDTERHRQVSMLLSIQEAEARWWRNACLLYFQQYSGMDFPADIEQPEGTLDYYKSLRFPYAPGH